MSLYVVKVFKANERRKAFDCIGELYRGKVVKVGLGTCYTSPSAGARAAKAYEKSDQFMLDHLDVPRAYVYTEVRHADGIE